MNTSSKFCKSSLSRPPASAMRITAGACLFFAVYSLPNPREIKHEAEKTAEQITSALRPVYNKFTQSPFCNKIAQSVFNVYGVTP